MLPTSIFQESSTTRSKREGRGQHNSFNRIMQSVKVLLYTWPKGREKRGKQKPRFVDSGSRHFLPRLPTASRPVSVAAWHFPRPPWTFTPRRCPRSAQRRSCAASVRPGDPDPASAPEGKEVTRPKQAHARQEKREPARREGGSSTAGSGGGEESSASKAGEMPSCNPSGSLYLAPQKRNSSLMRHAPAAAAAARSERAAPDAADSHIRLGLRRRLQPHRLPPADVNVTVTWLAANPKSIGRRSNHSPALWDNFERSFVRPACARLERGRGWPGSLELWDIGGEGGLKGEGGGETAH